MRQLVLTATATVILAVVFCSLGIGGENEGLQTQSNSNTESSNPCAAPNQVVGSPEETAWMLWIAATCPVNNNQYPYVVWEDWIEQAQMYPKDPSSGLQVPNAQVSGLSTTHLLHPSPLTISRNSGLLQVVPGLLGAPDENCNKASLLFLTLLYNG